MLQDLILGSVGLVLAISFIIIAKIIETSDKQSDKIMQNISNVSKLLEDRITIEQLLTLDMPTIKNIVSNEFHNIEVSYKELKGTGAINTYMMKRKI